MEESAKKHALQAIGFLGAGLFLAVLLRPKRAVAAPRDWSREYSEYSQPGVYDPADQTVDPDYDPALDPRIDRELDPEAPDTTVDPDKPPGTGYPSSYDVGWYGQGQPPALDKPPGSGFPSEYDLGYRDRSTGGVVDLTPPSPSYPQPPVRDYTYPTPYQPISYTQTQDPITSRGDAVVARYQSRLQTLGYDPGPIDGRYGELTRNAVRDFQRDAGLTVDGVLGPHTKAAIDQAYEGAGTSRSTTASKSYSTPTFSSSALSKFMPSTIATMAKMAPTTKSTTTAKSSGIVKALSADLPRMMRGDCRFCHF